MHANHLWLVLHRELVGLFSGSSACSLDKIYFHLLFFAEVSTNTFDLSVLMIIHWSVKMIERYQVEGKGVEGSILRYHVLLVSEYHEWVTVMMTSPS